MRRKAGLKAAVVGLISALTLSGCATVSVSAEVIDDKNAVFAIQKVVSHEGYLSYLNYLNEVNNETPAPPKILDLSGRWVQAYIAEDAPEHLELKVTSEAVELYRVSADGQELFWQGTFTPPSTSAATYSWTSAKVDNPIVPTDDFDGTANYLFDFNGSVISYISGDAEGIPEPFIFERPAAENPDAPVTADEEVTTENPESDESEVEPESESEGAPGVQLEGEQLCESFTKNVEMLDPSVAGVDPNIECLEDKFVVTTYYNVQYDYVGITAVNGEGIDSRTRDKLPFKFYVDQAYGDVVFEHRIIGLLGTQFPTTESWFEAVEDYTVSVTFPGAVNGFNGENSGAVSDGHTVTWGYDTVKLAVENGVYVLNAAGDPKGSIDPMPYILTAVGFVFLLSLLLFFSWRRFSASTIATISLFLIPVAPFGVGMAIIAQKKAKRDAAVKRRATISLVINGAVFTFATLVIVLSFVLAPQLVDSVLEIFGW